MASVKLQHKGIEALQERLNQKREQLVNVLTMRLKQLGEECVTYSKNNKGYQDRTGNLKNSISYALFLDGKLVTSAVGSIPDPEASAEGQKGVNEALENYAKENNVVAPKGYTLIVVAGMNYGKYVEDRGYNVLHLTKYYLQEQMGEIFREIIESLNN